MTRNTTKSGRFAGFGMLAAGLLLTTSVLAQGEQSPQRKLDLQGAQNGVPLSELAEGSPQAKALEKEIDTNFEFMTAKVLRKARQLLDSNGKFYPFAAAVGPNGKVNFAWTVSKEKENPNIDPAQALAALRQSLAANASDKRLLATAIVYQYGRVDESGQIANRQINIELEYITGDARVRAVPYETKEDGSIAFRGMGEQAMAPRVFAEVVAQSVKGSDS